MTEHEKVFFSILRSSLWGTPVEVPEGFSQWNIIMKLAKTQALMGLVGDVLLTRREIRDTLPPKFVEQLQDIPMTNVGMHSHMNMTLQLVVLTLRKAGVEPVLLKGQGLARNYPVPELRQCGDIDLYVGEKNYEKVYSLLEPIASEIDDFSRLAIGKHFHLKVANSLIEVHRFADVHASPTFNEIYQEYASEGLSKDLVPINFGDVAVNTPADNFNAFYVFNHLWHHFITEGVGLRQMCDWMLFLHTRCGRLDLDYLKQLLERMDLVLPWKTFGCILVDYLGLPSDEFPFYDQNYVSKGRMVLERIMKEGNFGQQTSYVRRRKHSYFYEKWFSLKCHVSRIIGLLRIFPRHSFRQFGYTISKGFQVVWKDKFKKNI